MFVIPRFYSNQTTMTHRGPAFCARLLSFAMEVTDAGMNAAPGSPASEQFRSAISTGLSHSDARDEHLLSLFQVPELSQPI
jgi:hypothetical protein